MTWLVEVKVSLRRPPRADASVYFAMSEADFSASEAELLACQLAQAHPRVVMPVGSGVTRVHSDV